MAATPAPKTKAKGKSFHGIPIWVIAVGGAAGAYLVYRWYKSKSAASTNTTTSGASTAGTTDTGTSDTGSGTGSGGGGTAPWWTNPTTSPATTTTTTPTTSPTTTPVATSPTTPLATNPVTTPTVGAATPAALPAEGSVTGARDAVTSAALAYAANPNPSTLATMNKVAASSGVVPAEVTKLETAAGANTGLKPNNVSGTKEVAPHG